MVGTSVRFAPNDSFTSAPAPPPPPPSKRKVDNKNASMTSMRIPPRLLHDLDSTSTIGNSNSAAGAGGVNAPANSSTQHPATMGSSRPSLATAPNYARHPINTGTSSNSHANLQSAIQKSRQTHQTALAAANGPSLAAALAQSIRHHARCIDGEHAKSGMTQEAMRMAAGVRGGGKVVIPPDAYEEEDVVSLAPTVELNFEKEAEVERMEGSLRNTGGNFGMVRSGRSFEDSNVLRDYVANVSDDDDGNHMSGIAGGNGNRKEKERSGDTTMNDRTNQLKQKFKIANWFRGKGSDDNAKSTMRDDATEAQTQSGDTIAAIAKAIASGDVNGRGEGNNFFMGNIWNVFGGSGGGTNTLEGTNSNFGAYNNSMGRTPTFIAPPPTSFRVATRHPSHHTPLNYDGSSNSSTFSLMGRGRPETLAMARKRQRRHDSFLRLIVALLCLALSFAFALFYGEGKFGLSLTSFAYERKIAAGGYDQLLDKGGKTNHYMNAAEEMVFYPDWWAGEKEIPDLAAKNVQLLPIVESNVADVEDERKEGRVETPFYWMVPRSGGNVVRTIMNQCLRFVEASELGAGSDEEVLLVEEDDGKRFVNVDTSTSSGLERAKTLDLATSGVPDVIISTIFHDVLALFNQENRARAFVVLRHPLERAISKYYSDLVTYPEVAGMTLTQYIREGGARVENNYVTRFLTGQYGGALGMHHLDMAREVLRRKFVVGLASDLPGTVRVFDYMFQWNNRTGDTSGEDADANDEMAKIYSCYDDILGALSDKSPPKVEEGTEGWKLLMAQNWLDLKVYEYAEFLFQKELEKVK
mmetsp:Transcript_14265/g.29133  ORF Transcript_14265/g.29133 Transcript_14265/m.29133 type:complete len:809 (-) Transcript_14265:96-2522(-)